jgi:hypothetical protein
MRRGDLIPMTPFYLFRVYGEASGVYDVRHTSGLHSVVAPFVNASSHWNITPETMKEYSQPVNDYLVQKAASKIYSEGYDFLTFLAELEDTKKMLHVTLKRLSSRQIPRWMERYTSRNYTTWKRLKDVSNEWLSLRYGWRPFFMDVEDLNSLITNLNSKVGQMRRHKRHANDVLTFSTSTESTQSSYYGQWTHVVSDSVTVHMRGSVTADVAIAPIHLNPLVTAWQVTKLSFVIDWLWNVSQALEALSFLALQHSYTAAFGQKVEVDRSYSGSLTDPDYSVYASGEETTVASLQATLQLRVPRKIPLFPQIALRLNAFKVVDLWALIMQRLRKIRR